MRRNEKPPNRYIYCAVKDGKVVRSFGMDCRRVVALLILLSGFPPFRNRLFSSERKMFSLFLINNNVDPLLGEIYAHRIVI